MTWRLRAAAHESWLNSVEALVNNWLDVGLGRIALTLFLLALGPAVPYCEDQGGKNASLCYAVLRIGNNSEILLQCDGQQHRIPTGGRITQFAVDQDGSTLALLRLRLKWVTSHTADGRFELGLVDLSGQGSVQVSSLKGGATLAASCGTILMFEGAKARNLISGEELRMKPYGNFRCSSDRKIVAGVKSRSSGELDVGSPPQRSAVRRRPYSHFELSPSGHYLAYQPSDTGAMLTFSRCVLPKCRDQRPVPKSVGTPTGRILYQTKVRSYLIYPLSNPATGDLARSPPLHFRSWG